MNQVDPTLGGKGPHQDRGRLLICLGLALVVLFALLTPKPDDGVAPPMVGRQRSHDRVLPFTNAAAAAALRRIWKEPAPESASEIVARRSKLFSKKQRILVHQLARSYKLEVPAEVETFFAALDAGDWPETKRLFQYLRDSLTNGTPQAQDLKKYWQAILEAYGAAQQAQI